MGVSRFDALAKWSRGPRRRRRARRDLMARELELRGALADRGIRLVRFDALPSPDAPIASHRRGRLVRELGWVCYAVVTGACVAGAGVARLLAAALVAVAGRR